MKGGILMIREAGIMFLNEGAAEEYEKRHNAIWPELVDEIKKYGGGNYTIFLDKETNQLFSYLEIEDEELWNSRAGSEITKKWWDYMADIMRTNSDNSPVFVPIQEVFHLD